MYQLLIESLPYNVSMLEIIRAELIVKQYLKPIHIKYQSTEKVQDKFQDMNLRALIEIDRSWNIYLRKYMTYHILMTSTNVNDLLNTTFIQEECNRMRPWLIEVLHFLIFTIEAYHAWEMSRTSYIRNIRDLYHTHPLFDRLLAGRLIEDTQFKHYFNSISDYTIPEIPDLFQTKESIILYMFLYKIRKDHTYSELHFDFITRLFTKLFDATYPNVSRMSQKNLTFSLF